MASQGSFGSALKWVVSNLDQHGVPNQVVGGLAAFSYGGSRSLYDIDLYAPLTGQNALLESLASRTLWGPERLRR